MCDGDDPIMCMKKGWGGLNEMIKKSNVYVPPMDVRVQVELID